MTILTKLFRVSQILYEKKLVLESLKKQAEAEVVPSSSSVEVKVEVGVLTIFISKANTFS